MKDRKLIPENEIPELIDKILTKGFVRSDLSRYIKTKYGIVISGSKIIDYLDEAIDLEDLSLNDLIGIKYQMEDM